jgi:hypothetical protein
MLVALPVARAQGNDDPRAKERAAHDVFYSSLTNSIDLGQRSRSELAYSALAASRDGARA